MPQYTSRWYPRSAATGSGLAIFLLGLVLTGTPVLLPAAEQATAEAAGVAKAELLFARLTSDLVVNLRGSGAHYLMVTAELQTRSQTDNDNAQPHAPAIRHQLLMNMGEMGYREALTIEGRQKLAEQALQTVREVLDEEAGGNNVEAVLFTSYLVE